MMAVSRHMLRTHSLRPWGGTTYSLIHGLGLRSPWQGHPATSVRTLLPGVTWESMP